MTVFQKKLALMKVGNYISSLHTSIVPFNPTPAEKASVVLNVVDCLPHFLGFQFFADHRAKSEIRISMARTGSMARLHKPLRPNSNRKMLWPQKTILSYLEIRAQS